jgi:glycerophosphoryl diester phosphodiesterase
MPRIIAHRGGGPGHLENTLEAVEAGLALGADMVEIDCRLSRDGVVVVVHDSTFKRVWGLPRAVADMEWAEVAAVRRGRYRVPRFEDVLSAVAAPLMVDIPGPAAAEACAVVARRAGALGRCLFAGHTGGLETLRRAYPEARVALSWEQREPPSPSLLASLRPEYFNPCWRFATRSLVARMHGSGIAVSTWTVNYQWAMRRALAAGVDAVITDNVGRLAAELRRRDKPAP